VYLTILYFEIKESLGKIRVLRLLTEVKFYSNGIRLKLYFY